MRTVRGIAALTPAFAHRGAVLPVMAPFQKEPRRPAPDIVHKELTTGQCAIYHPENPHETAYLFDKHLAVDLDECH